ncbi:hypothetical protein MMC25_007116 [Agyrium rufum]|nr:hypothetical protein [Agyrium rufum]
MDPKKEAEKKAAKEHIRLLQLAQLADLGNVRRHAITSSDYPENCGDVDEARMQATRPSNIRGTQQFQQAERNRGKLSDWAKGVELHADGQQAPLDNINEGQNHRKRLQETIRNEGIGLADLERDHRKPVRPRGNAPSNGRSGGFVGSRGRDIGKKPVRSSGPKKSVDDQYEDYKKKMADAAALGQRKRDTGTTSSRAGPSSSRRPTPPAPRSRLVSVWDSSSLPTSAQFMAAVRGDAPSTNMSVPPSAPVAPTSQIAGPSAPPRSPFVTGPLHSRHRLVSSNVAKQGTQEKKRGKTDQSATSKEPDGEADPEPESINSRLQSLHITTPPQAVSVPVSRIRSTTSIGSILRSERATNVPLNLMDQDDDAPCDVPVLDPTESVSETAQRIFDSNPPEVITEMVRLVLGGLGMAHDERLRNLDNVRPLQHHPSVNGSGPVVRHSDSSIQLQDPEAVRRETGVELVTELLMGAAIREQDGVVAFVHPTGRAAGAAFPVVSARPAAFVPRSAATIQYLGPSAEQIVHDEPQLTAPRSRSSTTSSSISRTNVSGQSGNRGPGSMYDDRQSLFVRPASNPIRMTAPPQVPSWLRNELASNTRPHSSDPGAAVRAQYLGTVPIREPSVGTATAGSSNQSNSSLGGPVNQASGQPAADTSRVQVPPPIYPAEGLRTAASTRTNTVVQAQNMRSSEFNGNQGSRIPFPNEGRRVVSRVDPGAAARAQYLGTVTGTDITAAIRMPSLDENTRPVDKVANGLLKKDLKKGVSGNSHNW